MPVYLFTFHGYGTWMPDHPKGFAQKGQGLSGPNRPLARAYRESRNHRPFYFQPLTQRLLIETALDVCRRRDWRFHAGACDKTHIHLLVSWNDAEVVWNRVRGKLKNILATQLSKASSEVGRPWFVDGASRRHVQDQAHFTFLMESYLPKHDGLQWYEDDRGWQTGGRA